ncbi:alpha/beta hydrolase family protein [Blastomonas sp. RAC04]|uniref:alpha/beta fold hydrolase n=1 Tax=Blastomonas sp. RAC04 TaxID=1842535 RepID=UPI00083E1E0F|nr:alpha/beta hydrolase [Blastomonas sp. RAC04]AOG00351.1 alpha/beta hydrolase family protein [Blastomonas sp. RAC04]
MMDLPLTRIALPTGVELDVAITGPADAPPLILLHGFPESHRTWRYVMAHFADRYRLIAPDQRGFAGSSKPEGVQAYQPKNMVADLLALADHLGVDTFTLVGHDWGGAIAWMAALNHPDRVKRLIMANAAHPFTYQKALFDDPDQRASAQYITEMRRPDFEDIVAQMGWDAYFDSRFAEPSAVSRITPEERAIYLAQWQTPGAFTAMVNWYRASPLIVPPLQGEIDRPAYLDRPFPPVTQPTLLYWAMDDYALRPSLLDGIETLVPDLTLVKAPGGHFVPWEQPDALIAAIEGFLAAR